MGLLAKVAAMRLVVAAGTVAQGRTASAEVEEPRAIRLDLAHPAYHRSIGSGLPRRVLHAGRVVGPAEGREAAILHARGAATLALSVEFAAAWVPARGGQGKRPSIHAQAVERQPVGGHLVQ